jgi:hypothetical protein
LQLHAHFALDTFDALRKIAVAAAAGTQQHQHLQHNHRSQCGQQHKN